MQFCGRWGRFRLCVRNHIITRYIILLMNKSHFPGERSKFHLRRLQISTYLFCVWKRRCPLGARPALHLSVILGNYNKICPCLESGFTIWKCTRWQAAIAARTGREDDRVNCVWVGIKRFGRGGNAICDREAGTDWVAAGRRANLNSICRFRSPSLLYESTPRRVPADSRWYFHMGE